MGKGKRRLAAAALVFCICLAAVTVLERMTGWAVFQETDAVHISADEIENATLVIGTHLIYLGSLNDEIYGIAQKSAEESGQYKVYYKSELGEGAWYEISSAYSIADITAGGTTVPTAEIEGLWLTHHTRSDGITYDLRSKEAVNTYDIYPAYDLETMKELEPLKNQYDLYKNGKEDNGNLKKVKKFFAKDVTSEKTELYDLQLQALSEYLGVLREHKADSRELAVMDKLIGKVDDGRRTEVYRMVDRALEQLLDFVSAGTDTELISAVSESQQNIQESLEEKEGNMLKEGTMVMTMEEYALAQKLVTAALERQHSICDEQAAKLSSLYHITDGEIIDAQAEQKLLEEELIPMAQRIFLEELGKGENTDYKAAKEKNSSHVVLEGIVDTQRQQQDTYRSELQFYIEAETDRLSAKEAESYITGRITEAGSFTNGIPQDNFAESAREVVDTHIKWLQRLLDTVTSENKNPKLRVLYEEKEELQEKKLDALDKEDIKTAKQKDVLLEAKDKEIQEQEAAVGRELQELQEKKNGLEQELEEKKNRLEQEGSGEQEENKEQGEAGRQEINSLTSQITDLEMQMAALNAGLLEGSGLKNIQDQKSGVLDLLEEGELSEQQQAELTEGMEGIGAMLEVSSSMAGSALKEIYGKMASAKYLKNTSQYDGWMEKIEELVAEHQDGLDSVLDGEEAVKALEESLGCSLISSGTEDTDDNASKSGTQRSMGKAEKNAQNKNQAVAAVALAMYSEQAESAAIEDALAGLVQASYRQENSYFFPVINKGSGSLYASAEAVSAYAGYRYIWNDSRKKAILASGADYYGFSAFQKEVERGKGKKDAMQQEASFQGTVFLPEDYLKQEFQCQVYSIGNTGFAVLADEEMLKKAAGEQDVLLRESSR